MDSLLDYKKIITEIKEITDDIEQLELAKDLTKDLKKNIIKYNNNSTKINLCKKSLMEIYNNLEQELKQEPNQELNQDIITDDTYNEYLSELENINIKTEDKSKDKSEDKSEEIFELDNIDDAIKKYKDLINKINCCKLYLENQKMSITHIN